jgi:hypothetical protein
MVVREADGERVLQSMVGLPSSDEEQENRRANQAQAGQQYRRPDEFHVAQHRAEAIRALP